jgi:hypothetical protein
LVLCLVALATAGAARADGDPASDFLYTGALYPSTFVSPLSPGVEGQLRGILNAAAKRGVPVKVALIAGPQDLGQYPQLFKTPQRYAQLLGAEIAIYRKPRAPVVVVAPSGFGVSGYELHGKRLVPVTAARGRVLLHGLPKPTEAKGDALAIAAMAAVRQIAKLEGHPLPKDVPAAALPVQPKAPTVSHPRKVSRWLLVSAVAALFFLSWLVFEVVASVRERRRTTGSTVPD